jgi:hypothetical protein
LSENVIFVKIEEEKKAKAKEQWKQLKWNISCRGVEFKTKEREKAKMKKKNKSHKLL